MAEPACPAAPPLGLLEFLDLLPDRPTAARRDTAVQSALIADRLGYARVWVPEHHGPAAPSTNPVLLAAVLGSHTRHARIGTAVVLARVRDPYVTAEDLATAAAFCRGRLDVGFGRGAVTGPAAATWRHRDDVATAAAIATVFDLLDHGRGFIEPAAGHQRWLHGAGGATAATAGRTGAGYCHAAFLNPDEDACRRAIADYRAAGGHRAAVAAAVVVGTDEHRVRADADAHRGIRTSCAGTAQRCAAVLHALAARVGADEVVVAELSREPAAHLAAVGALRPAWLAHASAPAPMGV